MLEFELNSYANQEFTTTIGENFYRVRLITFQGFTLADVWKNGEVVVRGAKCLPNKPIRTYEIKDPDGSFQFDCIDGNYPNYKLFDKTQKLKYYTQVELN